MTGKVTRSIILTALGLTLAANGLWARPATRPERILMIGDSMMQVPAHALNRRLEGIPNVRNHRYTSLGSGLARLDVFDWIEKARELINEFDPDATLVWFGANDVQPMQTEAGIVRPGTPEWRVEYARRVGEIMDLLSARDGASVHWLELPDMRDRRIQDDVALINDLIKETARTRERAFFVPTRPLLSRDPGTFSPFIIGPRGLPVQIRDPDGVHLNRAGAERITDHLVEYLLVP